MSPYFTVSGLLQVHEWEANGAIRSVSILTEDLREFVLDVDPDSPIINKYLSRLVEVKGTLKPSMNSYEELAMYSLRHIPTRPKIIWSKAV